MTQVQVKEPMTHTPDPAIAIIRRLRGIFPSIAEVDPYTLELYGEEGILVDVMPTGDLRISLYLTHWPGPHSPEPSRKHWRDVPGAASLDDDALRALLLKAVTARRRQYRRCFYCGERFAPEHYLDAFHACHGCGSRYHGIVY